MGLGLTFSVRESGDFVLELLRRERTELLQSNECDVVDAVLFRVLLQHEVVLPGDEDHLLHGPRIGGSVADDRLEVCAGAHVVQGRCGARMSEEDLWRDDHQRLPEVSDHLEFKGKG